jgi:hypothetical protein
MNTLRKINNKPDGDEAEEAGMRRRRAKYT